MTETVITCPHCHREFPLSETLAAPLLARLRQEMAAPLRERERALEEGRTALDALRDELRKREVSIDEVVESRVAAGRKAEQEQERKKAREEVDLELKGLRDEAEEQKKKLREAQKNELDLRRQKTELENQKDEMTLDIARQLEAERTQIRESVLAQAQEQYRLKGAEKDKRIADLLSTIEELKRKAEQGSEQLQGEVQELDLESLLHSAFPQDRIEPIPKGQRGADCFQHVVGGGGRVAGTILWESKRTKGWSKDWLPKLREDQRSAQAEIAVLMTEVLPPDVKRFDIKDRVWVTETSLAIPLATALRAGILQVSEARQQAEGNMTKMGLVYEYVCSLPFRQKVEAIVEAFVTMRSDLDAEKRAIQKHWKKRERQIERVVANTMGMYGDLQAIAGSSLQELEAVGWKALEAASGETGDEDE